MNPHHDLEQEVRAAMVAGNWSLVEVLAPELDNQPRAAPTLAGAALWYAQGGLPVFPLQPGAKVPYARTKGVHDATTDPERVTRFWTRNPTANIGLATGHRVDVIDFDGLKAHVAWPHDGWAGLDVLATVSTPRPGGLHLYVPATGDGNRTGIYPGVDYRGRGGYAVAPPSVLDDRPDQHPGTYRFLRPLHVEQL